MLRNILDLAVYDAKIYYTGVMSFLEFIDVLCVRQCAREFNDIKLPYNATFVLEEEFNKGIKPISRFELIFHHKEYKLNNCTKRYIIRYGLYCKTLSLSSKLSKDVMILKKLVLLCPNVEVLRLSHMHCNMMIYNGIITQFKKLKKLILYNSMYAALKQLKLGEIEVEALNYNTCDECLKCCLYSYKFKKCVGCILFGICTNINQKVYNKIYHHPVKLLRDTLSTSTFVPTMTYFKVAYDRFTSFAPESIGTLNSLATQTNRNVKQYIVKKVKSTVQKIMYENVNYKQQNKRITYKHMHC